MYPHRGQSFGAPFRDVTGVFDMDNTPASLHTRRFLERSEKEGRLVDISGDLPKSFALCKAGDGPPVVYLSQLSAATLLKRVEGNTFEV